MADQRLGDLEMASYEASQKFYQDYEAAKAADEKLTAAQETFNNAVNAMAANEYECDPNKLAESQKNLQEASKALNEAKSAVESATKALEESAQVAQDAQDAVEEKKNELRNSRATDTSFVVLMARSECSFGTRTSQLALDTTHGVYTKKIYQMTVQDMIANTNVINFCTCKSKENPKVIEAAQKVVDDANEQIANKERGWGERLVEVFVKPEKMEVTDGLLEQCEGECIVEFASGAVWSKGHEKVTINDEAPLLRRCELMCKYGGGIILLLSGQPE